MEAAVKVISIANQKGGVGKTTTAINLATTLARRNLRTLVIDLDPQGNASTGLGLDAGRRSGTVYDILLGDHSINDVAQDTDVPNLSIVPATTDLNSADAELMESKNRVMQLKAAIARRELPFHYVLIDCPPALNLLTLNAFVASQRVLVPLQAEFFALEGLSQLLRSVKDVRSAANPSLRVEGVILTMFDARNNICRQVEQDVRETLGDLVYRTRIPRNVRLSEAPSFGMPVDLFDPTSRGAVAYRALAGEFLRRLADEPEVACA